MKLYMAPKDAEKTGLEVPATENAQLLKVAHVLHVAQTNCTGSGCYTKH